MARVGGLVGWLLRSALIAGLILGISAPAARPVHAAMKTWSGAGANANWSNRFNWQGGIAPVAGDDLVFPSSAPSFTTNDFPDGTGFDLITLGGLGYTLGGHTIALTSGLTDNTTSGSSITLGLTQADSASIRVTNAQASLSLSGPISIANTAILTVTGAGTITLPTSMSGRGGLLKTGGGTAVLSGNNGTFSGPIQISEGELRIRNQNALGTTAGSTVVVAGAALVIDTGLTNFFFSEPLVLNGTGISGTGAFRVASGSDASTTGRIELDTPQTTIGVDDSASFLAEGQVVGSGGLTKVGPGTLSLVPPSNNPYQGTTTVSAGRVLLGGSEALGLSSAGTTVAAGANLEWSIGSTIYTNSDPLTLNGTGGGRGALTISAAPSVGTSFWQGPITLNTADAAIGIGAGLAFALDGGTTGGGGLTTVGDGTLVLVGQNTYTGTTTVGHGILLVNGTLTASPTSVTGGTLGGTGTLKSVTASAGTVRPGIPPGALVPGTGTLTANGDVQLNAGSTFEARLNGTTAGTQYDQLKVNGAVTLGGVLTVDVGAGFTPAVGESFTILDNDGTDPIVGTFNGLPDGAILILNNLGYRISYHLGSGNDVVLTRVNIGCAPRQRVGVQSVRDAPGELRVTIIANASGGSSDNRLDALTFDAGRNSLVDVRGLIGQTSAFTVPLSDRPIMLTFEVRRQTAGQAVQLPFTVVDDCGPWRTFVGAGPAALN